MFDHSETHSSISTQDEHGTVIVHLIREHAELRLQLQFFSVCQMQTEEKSRRYTYTQF